MSTQFELLIYLYQFHTVCRGACLTLLITWENSLKPRVDLVIKTQQYDENSIVIITKIDSNNYFALHGGVITAHVAITAPWSTPRGAAPLDPHLKTITIVE